VPSKVTGVDHILQDAMDFGLHHPSARAGMRQADGLRLEGQCLERVGAGGVELK
jgi:hypothetical protein